MNRRAVAVAVDSGAPVLGEYCVFADPNLENDVRNALQNVPMDGGVPSGPIPVTVAAKLTDLDTWCDCSDTLDFGGVECLTGLQTLGLGGTFSNFDRLKYLPNLKTLTFEYQGASLPPELGQLTQIESLDFRQGNSVDDLSGFETLVNLRSLDLRGNSVTDLTPLAGLTKLETLDLTGNQVGSLQPLQNLKNLRTLHASNNPLTDDLAGVSGLTALEDLEISTDNVTALTALSGLTNLTRLLADANTFTDLSPLQGLVNLNLLSINSSAAIKDFSPLVNNAGIDSGDTIYASPNAADCASFKADLATLTARGVLLYNVPTCP